MGLLPDTQNCGLRMRRKCLERFPRHRFQRKPLVSDPGMHHGTCVKHVPWCMSGSLTNGGGENVPGIPGACATRNFAYLVRGPFNDTIWYTASIFRATVMMTSCEHFPRYWPFVMGTTSHRWIPLTYASLLWSAPDQTVVQTIETLVIWDAIALIMTSFKWLIFSVQQYRTISNLNTIFTFYRQHWGTLASQITGNWPVCSTFR